MLFFVSLKQLCLGQGFVKILLMTLKKKKARLYRQKVIKESVLPTITFLIGSSHVQPIPLWGWKPICLMYTYYYANSYTYLSKWHNPTKDNLVLLWPQDHGEFLVLDKSFHLSDALRETMKNVPAVI